MRLTRRQANLAGLLACAGMLAFAMYAQHGMGLVPCNMCLLQRGAVALVGIAFLLALVHDPDRVGARGYAALIGLAALTAVAVAGRHVWMQLQPPGSLPSCGADLYTMLQMLPVREALTKVLMGGGDCQRIDWTLLGLSMPAWVMLACAALGAGGATANVLLERAGSGPTPR
jgi:protein dithiol:quinone oxidoreductase